MPKQKESPIELSLKEKAVREREQCETGNTESALCLTCPH